LQPCSVFPQTFDEKAHFRQPVSLQDRIRFSYPQEVNIWQAGVAPHLLGFMQNPSDVGAIQEIYRCYTKDQKIQDAVEEVLLADPRFRELYETRYMPEPYTLDQLKTLPPNTFGYMYASFMEENNLKLDFIDDFSGSDILSYLWCRAKHVHDITHLIVGFDTSLLGEAGVKGFELAQYRSPAAAAIFGGGILSVSAIEPRLMVPMLNAFVAGYSAGQTYPLLNGIKWDLEWETPMEELRRKNGIPAPVAIRVSQ
jgi:ubiquinone biosynthesis protein Coq4